MIHTIRLHNPPSMPRHIAIFHGIQPLRTRLRRAMETRGFEVMDAGSVADGIDIVVFEEFEAGTAALHLQDAARRSRIRTASIRFSRTSTTQFSWTSWPSNTRAGWSR